MKLGSLMLLSALLVGCGGGGGDGGGGPPTGPNPPASPNPSAASVQMRTEQDPYGYDNSYFAPTAAAVARNGSVTWTNSTGVDHNVTFAAVSGAPANIASFTSGQVSRTFATAGTFNYSCTNHAGMTGTITVQ